MKFGDKVKYIGGEYHESVSEEAMFIEKAENGIKIYDWRIHSVWTFEEEEVRLVKEGFYLAKEAPHENEPVVHSREPLAAIEVEKLCEAGLNAKDILELRKWGIL